MQRFRICFEFGSKTSAGPGRQSSKLVNYVTWGIKFRAYGKHGIRKRKWNPDRKQRIKNWRCFEGVNDDSFPSKTFILIRCIHFLIKACCSTGAKFILRNSHTHEWCNLGSNTNNWYQYLRLLWIINGALTRKGADVQVQLSFILFRI